MPKPISRRQWLGRAAGAAGACAVGRLTILAADAPNAKLGTALIGCGGRGTSGHLPTAVQERIVALVDPDEKRAAAALKWVANYAEKHKVPGFKPESVKLFADYRRLFDAMGKDLDAVFIASPDHHHALPCTLAVKAGVHVYCEKPITHNIGEARVLAEVCRQHPKVMTQMGNQGLAAGGDQALAEYLAAGTLGKLLEVHSWHAWTGRFGGSMPRPPAQPVPAGLDWDLWLGPAPYRDYHAGIHPGVWHGWCDFGTGSIGGWSTHVLDAVFFALELGAPSSVEVLEMDDPSDDRFPARVTIRYDFPQRPARGWGRPELAEGRGEWPPATVYWYDGSYAKAKDPSRSENAPVEKLNRPKLALELEKKHDRRLGGAASLFVGEKGVIHVGSHGGAPRIIPEEQHKATPVPPRKLPRPKGGILGDFIRACKEGGDPPISNFAGYACPLMECIYVGHVAIRAGVGKKLEWDGEKLACTNIPEANRWVSRKARKGWEM